MDIRRKKFGGVIETLPKNGSYAISIPSEEDRKEIASWFEGCGSLTKKLLYPSSEGEVANRVYARSSNLGTFPAGCGLREKCLISFSINDAGYVSVIVQPTDAAKRKVEQEKVMALETKKQLAEDAELFGVDVSKVQAAMFAQKFGFNFSDVVSALGKSETRNRNQNQNQKQQQKPEPQPQPDPQPEPEFFGEGNGEGSGEDEE